MIQTQEAYTGFDAYVNYLAFKLHFQSSTYNFFKFNGKTKAHVNSFNTRKDKYHFDKIAAKIGKDPFIYRMLQERIDNPNFWIKDILTKENESKYLTWKGFIEGFNYNFKKELGIIKEWGIINDIPVRDLFKTKNSSHPIVFKMYLKKNIRLETLICLDNLIGFIDKLSDSDPVCKETKELISGYKPFIESFVPEKKMLAKMFIDVFEE
jgi:hypothetical protein